jgi:hypothetical protein
MYTGPNTVKDGLIFGYDTGYGVADNNTSTRLYPGRPTTNILSNTVDFNNWTLARNSGSYPTVTANTSANPLGKSYGGMADKVYIPEDGTYPRIQQYFTPSSTNTHTFSVWIRSLSGDCNCFLGAFRNSPWSLPGSSVKSITSEWQRFTFSWTPPDTTTHVIYMGSHDTAAQKGNTLEFWGAQMENNSTSTPYTPGSRSSTQSLIDLTKSTTIDVSNVSFDSLGQPTFDGTDDYILTPFTRGTLGDQLTMIAYYKFDGSTSRTYTPIFGGKESGAGTEFFIGKNSGNTHIGVQDGNYTGAFVQGSDAWDGNYHQIVYTYENGSGKIYLDGVLKNTGTFSKCNTAEQITVGSEVEGSGYYMIGDIPRACVFDRVLTADEILKDFNANKNRFNI